MLKNLFQFFRGNDGAMASDLLKEEMDVIAEMQYEKVVLDRDLNLGVEAFVSTI